MEPVALKLFQVCDRDNKGFIVKRDMQKMQEETGLTSEQLEIVFDALDGEKIGYLTLDQFLTGFREYTVLTNWKGANEEHLISTDYKDDFSNTLNLIRETNILKTSADELENICEQMKHGTACQISQWEMFLKDLNQDLQTYRNAHLKLEQLMKEKESQHQIYVRKLFEEIEGQLKNEKEKYCEKVKSKVKEEIKELQKELLAKDQLLQQLNTECEELKEELLQIQKKQEEMISLNSELLSQQSQYEIALEAEQLKKNHIHNVLDNIKRRFSIEKKQYFNDGFQMAKKIISLQEEGLIQQLRMLQDMQNVLSSEGKSSD